MDFKIVYNVGNCLLFFSCSYDIFQNILSSVKKDFPVSFLFNEEEHYSIDFYFYPDEFTCVHFLSVYFDIDEFENV